MDDELQVPRHMRSPGDDGYRTPTIEDAERTLSELAGDSPGGAVREVHTTALEAALQRASSRVTDATNKEYNNGRDQDGSSLTRRVTDTPPSHLSWKKRIRHVTWAYFTLTMATGGLANVFYEGKRGFYPN